MLSYWVPIVAIVSVSFRGSNCLPIKVSDIASHSFVTTEDVKILLRELEGVKDRVKFEAFKAFTSEVESRGTTVESTRNIIDVVKFIMTETLQRIDNVSTTLSGLTSNPDILLKRESQNYVLSVEEMIPQIVPFVIKEYNSVLVRLKKAEALV